MDQKDASFALIFHNDRILLFHRDNIPTIPFPDCWHLPGGGIETGETSEEGMRRELEEEVTHIPKKLEFLGEVKRATHKIYIYNAFVRDNEVKLFKKGGDEGQEIGFFSPDQVSSLKLTNILKTLFSRSNINELKFYIKEKNLKPLLEKYKRII